MMMMLEINVPLYSSVYEYKSGECVFILCVSDVSWSVCYICMCLMLRSAVVWWLEIVMCLFVWIPTNCSYVFQVMYSIRMGVKLGMLDALFWGLSLVNSFCLLLIALVCSVRI